MGGSLRCNRLTRFGVPQGEESRSANGLRQSSTCRAAQVLSPINVPICDHFSSAIRSLMAKLSGRPLRFARAGGSETYKQPLLAPNQNRLAAISLRDPQSGYWSALLPNTQLLGCATAVLQYSCLSRIIATLATLLRKIPTAGYFGPSVLISNRRNRSGGRSSTV